MKLFASFMCFVTIFLATSQASTSSAERRSNRLLHFLASQEAFRDFGLATIINNRCNRYMNYSERVPCREAVKKMIQLLDYDMMIVEDKKLTVPSASVWMPQSFLFVAFKSNLMTLLESANTTQYLAELKERLYLYLTDQTTELNIWDFTLSYFKSPYLTAMVMATLFQDTSIKKLHLAYLERTTPVKNERFVTNMEMTRRVIDTINLVLDISEDNYRKIFYPKEVYKNLNRNIYHFYVPLFLSMSMSQQGIHPEFAFRAALMLTLSYEFITSANDYRYLLRDPETINLTGKVKDIFGGYCGSNIGVRGMNFTKSFEIIQESFARSTADSVQLLLRH